MADVVRQFCGDLVSPLYFKYKTDSKKKMNLNGPNNELEGTIDKAHTSGNNLEIRTKEGHKALGSNPGHAPALWNRTESEPNLKYDKEAFDSFMAGWY